jgi:hypothetical protein
MTRIPVLTLAVMTVASAALAQSNPNPGATPNSGVGTAGPTFSAPGNQGGATPSPGMGGTFSGPGGTTGASPSVGAGTGAGPTFTTPPPDNSNTQQQPNQAAPSSSTPVPPNSNAGHPPDPAPAR